MLSRSNIFEFVNSRLDGVSETKDIIFVLLNITPISKDDAEFLGVGKNSLIRIISRLRSEGQEIQYDPNIGYYIVKKNPYRLFLVVESKEDDNTYHGKLFGIYPAVVRTEKKLQMGVNIVRGIIEGFDGEKLIIKS